MKTIKIDGSFGEGGGQVLRTSLTLSAITGQPFTIENIRAGRKKPGLMRQHLTCVQAAAAICGADVSGAEVGSTSVSFSPGGVAAGDYEVAIGTAGSTMLVLQTLLPALMLADKPSKLRLIGGTHNKQAPSYDFIAHAFVPVLEKMGVHVACKLEQRGFYPAGGGRVEFSIVPTATLKPLYLREGGVVQNVTATAVQAKIPQGVAERELKIAKSRLELEEVDCFAIDDRYSSGPGNSFWVQIDRGNITEIFTQHGELGVSAESVAKRACKDVERYLRRPEAAVGPYLADQLLLPMALAGDGAFTTLRPSLHTQTNIETIKNFLNVEITVQEVREGIWEIRVQS